jgi:hypothetical protein
MFERHLHRMLRLEQHVPAGDGLYGVWNRRRSMQLVRVGRDLQRRFVRVGEHVEL